jgi:hypothetical protein
MPSETYRANESLGVSECIIANALAEASLGFGLIS